MGNGAALQARLAAGDLILLDGAIGTELERLGAPMHRDNWCGHALETHPDLVREVHRSYIDAGADVITANTYCTGRHALALAGVEEKTEAWNRLAVEMALGARDTHGGGRAISIAGSIAPFGGWRTATAEALRPNFAEQAELLVAAGVDLLILEMLAAPPDFVEAAIEVTRDAGVPVWVSMSCMEERETGRLMFGVEESRAEGDSRTAYEPFADVVRRVDGMGGSALLMMHSDLGVTRKAVVELRASATGPIGAYPNAGYWLRPQWAFVDQVTPEKYLEEARAWVAAGARIVGGCCGIGPTHIRALRENLLVPA